MERREALISSSVSDLLGVVDMRPCRSRPNNSQILNPKALNPEP